MTNAEHSNHNDDGNVHKNEEQTTSIPLGNDSSFVADNPDPHTNNNTDTTTEKDTSASEPQNDDTTRIDADHTTLNPPQKLLRWRNQFLIVNPTMQWLIPTIRMIKLLEAKQNTRHRNLLQKLLRK